MAIIYLKKKIPLVYLQNSGLGNATDPITNLMSKYVYNIPLILLIGRRGAPKVIDESQHVIQGKSLPTILKQYEIKFIEIKSDNDFLRAKKLISIAKKNVLELLL